MCEAKKQISQSTTNMTMTPTISSLESSSLAICSPLHVNVHCRLFFVQSVQEARAFTYGKCHDRRSQRSPSSSFVHSHWCREVKAFPVTSSYWQIDGQTPHNYNLNIMIYIEHNYNDVNRSLQFDILANLSFKQYIFQLISGSRRVCASKKTKLTACSLHR